MSLRSAIIGIGNIAPIHATAIKTTPDATLVALCTRDSARGRAFIEKYGGKYFANYRDVLARDDVDVVAICTPHDLHAPMMLEAAKARKHALVEKPMARNVAKMAKKKPQ